jgi:hypothetical protein
MDDTNFGANWKDRDSICHCGGDLGGAPLRCPKITGYDADYDVRTVNLYKKLLPPGISYPQASVRVVVKEDGVPDGIQPARHATSDG